MNFNDLLINENSQNLTHDKWNKIVNFNASLDSILYNIIGPSYKGEYNPQTDYELYDYLWIDNKLVIVNNVNENLIRTFDVKENYHNAIYTNDGLFYINKNGNIKKVLNNSNTIMDSISVDEFKINYKGEIVSRKGDRFYKIINNKVIPLNITFGSEIIDYAIDKNFIYFISEGIIRYGNIYNSDNTYFHELKLDIDPLKISVSSNYIFILDCNLELYLIDKSNFEFKKYIIPNLQYKENIKIFSINDKFFGIYNGSNNIDYYSINNENIKFSYSRKIDDNSQVLFSENTDFISVSNKNNIEVIKNTPFSYKEVDICKVLSFGGAVHTVDYLISIDYSKGQTFNDGFSPSINTASINENKGLVFSHNSQLLYENFVSLIDKTVIIEVELSNTFTGTNIGYIKNNNKQVFLNNEGLLGNLKIIINFKETSSDIFLYKDNKFIKYIEKVNSLTNENKEFLIKGNGITLNKIIVLNKLNDKEENDLYGKNTILTNDFSFDNLKPFNYIKSNNLGNTIIQTGTDNVKGILNISSDFIDNNYTAFSTKGAKILFDKIEQINKILSDSFAPKNHKHSFNEILNVPTATNNQKGIVYLASGITDDSSKAANSHDLKTVYDLANHTHPYLRIDGGEVTGYTSFFQIFSKEFNSTDATIKNLNSVKLNSDNILAKTLNVTTSTFTGYSTFNGEIISNKKITANSIISSSCEINETLFANNIKTNNLTSQNGTITTINSTNIQNNSKIKTNNLESPNATITNLNSSKINVSSIIINGYTLTIE